MWVRCGCVRGDTNLESASESGKGAADLGHGAVMLVAGKLEDGEQGKSERKRGKKDILYTFIGWSNSVL